MEKPNANKHGQQGEVLRGDGPQGDKPRGDKPRGDGLLAVHAHPDDEVIMTGGVLARASDEGRPTAVVTCTGGELGEIVGEGMDPEAIRPHLARVRREELAQSLAILGAGEPRLLGYRDSGMMGTPGNDHHESFWRAPMDIAIGRVVAHIRSFRPAVVITYDAFGGYGHPDHIQAHRVAVLGVEAAAMPALYPQAGSPWQVTKLYLATLPRTTIVRINTQLAARGLPSPFGGEGEREKIDLGVEDDMVGARVDVRPWLERKWQALRAHRSQVGEDSFFLNTPDDLREEMFGTEWFIRARAGRHPSGGLEDDVFAGLGVPRVVHEASSAAAPRAAARSEPPHG